MNSQNVQLYKGKIGHWLESLPRFDFYFPTYFKHKRHLKSIFPDYYKSCQFDEFNHKLQKLQNWTESLLRFDFYFPISFQLRQELQCSSWSKRDSAAATFPNFSNLEQSYQHTFIIHFHSLFNIKNRTSQYFCMNYACM